MADECVGAFDSFSQAAASVLEEGYHTSGWVSKVAKGNHSTNVNVEIDHTAGKKMGSSLTLSSASVPYLDQVEFASTGDFSAVLNANSLPTMPKMSVPMFGDLGLEFNFATKFDFTTPVEGLVANKAMGLDECTTASATTTLGTNTRLKVEVPPVAWQKKGITVEATHMRGNLTLGTRFNNKTGKLLAPDLALGFSEGRVSLSLESEGGESHKGSAAYDWNVNTKIAATYCYGGSENGSWCIGAQKQVCDNVELRAKVQQDQSVQATFKYDTCSGVSVLVGGEYNKGFTSGVQFCIE
eukprot:NODE_14027_length_1133_cov_3.368787.p1 GENE.NODE_14027_length_1133_cov_3.368787~~NODE_14027_length_1133_cov_3.368787.p1  ORF type:complete len:297 (+),score=64.40 NODE_14027_length_1133_cov_3.368787:61-951(+)